MYAQGATAGDVDLWVLDTEVNETELNYEATGAQNNAVFSPDGEWVAYQSDESGRPQIWVQLFPATGARYQITTGTGYEPLWSPDRQDLFFLGPGFGFNSVSIDTQSGFAYRANQNLPVTGILLGQQAITNFDIMPDGQRFLVVREVSNLSGQTGSSANINIVLNWFEELKERVPVP